MTSSNTLNWVGRAAIVAGVIYILLAGFFLVSSQTSDDYHFPTDYLVEASFAVALALTAVALAGLHLGLGERYGRLGTGAVILAAVGHAAMFVSAAASTVAGADTIDVLIPIGFLIAIIGGLLLGIATWRERVLPRWCAVLLLIGYPATITLGDYGGLIPLGVAWCAIGYYLLTNETQVAVTSTSAA